MVIKMKRYFIEDDESCFWCENKFGFWSNYSQSLKHRFQGIFFWVFPLYLLMRISNVNCKMKVIENV